MNKKRVSIDTLLCFERAKTCFFNALFKYTGFTFSFISSPIETNIIETNIGHLVGFFGQAGLPIRAGQTFFANQLQRVNHFTEQGPNPDL